MVTQQWPDPPDEPAALAGIEPVAEVVQDYTSGTLALIRHKNTVKVGDALYSDATVERLVQERDKWASLKESVAIAALERDHALEQLAAMTQERGDYRAALEYKSKREEALKARDLKCACDHNEYCSKCFPLDFREGGMFYETPDSVMRNALAKYPRKADEAKRLYHRETIQP